MRKNIASYVIAPVVAATTLLSSCGIGNKISKNNNEVVNDSTYVADTMPKYEEVSAKSFESNSECEHSLQGWVISSYPTYSQYMSIDNSQRQYLAENCTESFFRNPEEFVENYNELKEDGETIAVDRLNKILQVYTGWRSGEEVAQALEYTNLSDIELMKDEEKLQEVKDFAGEYIHRNDWINADPTAIALGKGLFDRACDLQNNLEGMKLIEHYWYAGETNLPPHALVNFEYKYGLTPSEATKLLAENEWGWENLEKSIKKK